MGQLQSFTAVFPQELHGPTCVFWANLTPFSLKVDHKPGTWESGGSWQGFMNCVGVRPVGGKGGEGRKALFAASNARGSTNYAVGR